MSDLELGALWDDLPTSWDDHVTQHTDRARTTLQQPEDPLHMVNSQPWMALATCRSIDPDLWFSDLREEQAQQALAVCRTCPVMRQCRDYALALVRSGEHLVGVWGGTTPTERARLTGTKPRR